MVNDRRNDRFRRFRIHAMNFAIFNAGVAVSQFGVNASWNQITYKFFVCFVGPEMPRLQNFLRKNLRGFNSRNLNEKVYNQVFRYINIFHRQRWNVTLEGEIPGCLSLASARYSSEPRNTKQSFSSVDSLPLFLSLQYSGSR